MGAELIFSKSNTQALKGVAALGIVFFHVIWGFNVSPLLNMWGAFLVTIFIVLSGYGLEESYRINGLSGYWQKRLEKVVLPVAFFVYAYNYLFPFILPNSPLFQGSAMHKCLDELLYVTPTFWYVFFILKCYTVYWIGVRFLSERYRMLFYVVCAILCLNLPSPSRHLEAEQSFSFLAGIILSRKKQWLNSLSSPEVYRWMGLLFFVGFISLCLKTIPYLHDLKGTIVYNYMLCPFRLSMGLAFIPLISLMRPYRSAILQKVGRYSMEIYIAHIPFTGIIKDMQSMQVFFACSLLGFLLLILYRILVEKRISAVEAIFIIVNVLFVAKYSSRISEQLGLCATLLAIVFYYVLCRFCKKIVLYGKSFTVFCLVCIIGMIAVQYALDPYTLRVDRWSALHFPIQNLLSGEYPYSASTHLGGYASPFPVWQLLHIPFYLIGNVGLSFFFAFLLFLRSIYKVQGKSKALLVAVLMCSSVAVWYEVAVRSDLLTNVLLVAALINYFISHLNSTWVERNQWWIAAIIGLLGSTRMNVLIPLVMLLLPYYIKLNWQRQIFIPLVVLLIFALTFVPFAIWDWQQFYYFDKNPWTLQTSQVNLSNFFIFVPLVLFLTFNHKQLPSLFYRNSAIALMAFVAVTFISNMYSGSNWDLFSSTFDITYLSTALPFSILAIVCKSEE